MATLNVIYKIAADISGMTAAVEKAAKSTENLEGMAKRVGDTLTKAFTVAAIGAVAKEVLDVAGHLTDLSAKTGISTTGLQKLDLAFSQAGVSLDTVTGSIAKLSKNLIGGDKTAVSAMQKLGLSINELKALSPDELFIKVADKIGAIANPTEKAYAAMAIFGKGGVELLAGLDGHLEETTKAFEDMGLIIDEKTIKAADDFGDQLGLMGKQLLGIVATLIGPLLPALSALGTALMWIGNNVIGPVLNGAIKTVIMLLGLFWEGLSSLLGRLAELATKIPIVGKHLGFMADAADWLNTSSAKTTEYLKNLWNTTDKVGTSVAKTAPALLGLGDDMEKASAAAKKAAEEHKKFTDSVTNLTSSAVGAAKGFGPFGLLMTDLSVNAGKFRQTLDNLNASVNEYHNGITDAGDEMATVTIPMFSTLPNVIAQSTDKIKDAGEAIKQSFGDRALDLLGGVSQILGTVRSKWAETSNAIVTGTQKVISAWKNAHDTVGIVVAVAVTAWTVISKLWTNAEKQVNPVRQAYVDLAGGLAALDLKAHNAGMTLTAMLNAKTPEAYKKAIDDLNAAFQLQDDAMKLLNDAVEKYGFTIDQLGPKFAAQKLHEQAAQLYQDYMVLTAAGIDHNAIIEKMAPSLQEYVNKSMLAGVAIPEQMRPALQSMVDMGLLVDANGNKMTDLSHLTFAETLDQKFTTLIATIDRLANAIAGTLGNALHNIPTGVNVDVSLNAHWNIPELPRNEFAATGGLVTAHGIQHFAAGGNVLPFRPMGTDTVPAMLTPGEMVLTEEQQRSVFSRGSGGGGQGVDVSGLHSQLSGLRADMARRDRSLPRELVRALRDQRLTG